MSSGRDHAWRAGDGVVVRTPLLPFTTLLEWAAAPDPRAYLAGVLADRAVDEAIFVASPSLHGSLDKWRAKPESAAGQRIEQSLAKYVARMAGRSTPFGLFSGVSAGTLGRETKLELAPRGEYRRRTRLDNDYLFVLADELGKRPEVREQLIYRPNTSIYQIAGRLRFAAARLDGKERKYHLVSVEPTPYLEATLARAAGGARLAELAAPLVDPEITVEEARGFVEELVAAQLLVPELGVHITGPEPIDGLLAQLRAAAIEAPIPVLDSARTAIAEIDAAGVGNSPERYRAIATSLEQLGAKVDLSLLFQVDMVKPAAMTLGNRVAADVAHAVAQIARISAGGESLDEWRGQFRERWEDREVALAEALDEESGIGFEAARGPGSEGSPLLAGIGFPGGAGEMRVAWRGYEAHMLRRLATALAAGDTEIVLDDKDLDAMKLERPARLPDAFAVMTRLAASPEELAKGELTVLFEGTSGPSGAKLLGRFCHASAEIDAMVRAHHTAEEALAPGPLFAEIVHLNEGRIGNILCRPVLRGHEIVFLAHSGAPEDHRITLDDLLVSVRGDRIVLRSHRLGREIVPRLTTAHNFRLRSLGVYRFLCAVAAQGVQNTSFRWGVLDGAPYLPRVRMGRVVLARAEWNLGEADLAPITAAVREAAKVPAGGSAKIAAAVAALREARKLPRFVVIASGDNELPVDFDNKMLVAAFADEISGSTGANLIEMFPAPDKLIVKGAEGQFANEVLLTFTRSKPEAQPELPPVVPAPTARRQFVPGSEWLYAKIYCGESTGDRVLREAIAPVVREVMAAGDADRWFFIRYRDPEAHVRVRFHGDPARLANKVLPALRGAVAPLLDGGVARKLVLDAYDREIERYGGDRGIDLVEDMFWRDSEAILGIVELIEGDAGATARWQLALRGIDSLLESIGLDADARDRVVSQGRDMLGREMSADTGLWGRIGDRFTKERAMLDLLFARDPARDAESDLAPGFELLATRDAHIRALAVELRKRDAAGELAPPIAQFAWSLVHMHANRLLHASQRAQELVLYDFLRRLHASRRARAKAK